MSHEEREKHALVAKEKENLVLDASTQENQNSKVEVLMALHTLNGIYQENIRSYADSLHDQTLQIESAQNRLELLQKELIPHAKIEEDAQKEIDYELRTLERYTQEWNQIIVVIDALSQELQQLNHSSDERDTVLRGREENLNKLQKDIQSTELRLLEQELQKQNILQVIQPIQKEITHLELNIKQLTSQKRYIESAYLHHLTPTASSKQIEAKSDVIDV